MSKMYLVRHGATKQNEHKPVILQGNGLNGGLSERGEQQARDVAGLLGSKEIAAVYASPMLRAQQTAQTIADQHGLTVHTVAELHEVNVGEWEGMTWAQIMESEPESYQRFMTDHTFPYRGGESFQCVLQRVLPALEDLMAKHPTEPIAVVAHNVVNRVYLAHLLGRGLEGCRTIRQMNCCVNLIRHEAGKPELISMNSVFHLSEW